MHHRPECCNPSASFQACGRAPAVKVETRLEVRAFAFESLPCDGASSSQYRRETAITSTNFDLPLWRGLALPRTRAMPRCLAVFANPVISYMTKRRNGLHLFAVVFARTRANAAPLCPHGQSRDLPTPHDVLRRTCKQSMWQRPRAPPSTLRDLDRRAHSHTKTQRRVRTGSIRAS